MWIASADPLFWEQVLLIACLSYRRHGYSSFIYTCHSLQLADPLTGEKMPHKVPHAHSQWGSLAAAPHNDNPPAWCRLLLMSHKRAAVSGLGWGCDAGSVTSGNIRPGFDCYSFLSKVSPNLLHILMFLLYFFSGWLLLCFKKLLVISCFLFNSADGCLPL